ncbi:ATP-binding protein [Actinoplanes sp. NPDC051470]|uniref:ATP-binding protein n=1 Tax=unclassified Actinoplanes TaxID=2626549 RepID=UPI0034123874
MRRDDPARLEGRDPGTAGPSATPENDGKPVDGAADGLVLDISGAAGPGRSEGGMLTGGAADQIAELVARAARAPTGLIYFLDEAGERLVLSGAHGLPGTRADAAEAPLAGSLGEPIVGTGQPLVIEDIAADPRIPDGSRLRIRDTHGAFLGHPVRDDEGAITGICCAYDTAPRRWTPEQIAAVSTAAQVSTLLIAERRARWEVDRQRRFLDGVLDSLHDGVTACDADGRIVLVNARMREMWGEAAPDGAPDGLTDADGKPVSCDGISLFRALRGEQLRDHELVLRRKGRRTRRYLVDARPIIGADGRPTGAVQAVQDATRRRRVERFRTCELAVTMALADAPTIEAAGPRVLEAVVSTLDWAHAELWLVDDAAGMIQPAACWSRPGWTADIDVPAELPYGRGLAGRVWQVGKPLWIRDVNRPQSLISPETAAASDLHTALALPVRHGLEPLGVLTVFAESIEDPEDEVLALLSGVTAMVAQFVDRQLVEDLQRQLTRSKNEYLALIGHELRTPLTSISAYTEILREIDPSALAADGPALLDVVDRNTTRLRRIIDELLELSALDTGHAAMTMAPVDLADVVRESVERTREVIDGSPLSLNAELPDELVLPGDRRRLKQIVDNLLGNAVKYSPDGGRITVRLKPVGRAAELSVSDTGIGIAPEERERLFTRLHRASMVRDKAIPGTGLGLALSRAVVKRHHGTIELADHEGPGTTVRVRLPLDAR